MPNTKKRRLPSHIDYITSPGWLTGGNSRTETGLIRGGPSVIVTTKGVLRFRPTSHEAYLANFHAGLTATQVAEDTGFELEVADATPTPSPTPDELYILREVVDPERVFFEVKTRGRFPCQRT